MKLKDEIEKVLDKLINQETDENWSAHDFQDILNRDKSQALTRILELVEKEKTNQEVTCLFSGLNCKYNYLNGIFSGCRYQRYCDYQLPKDSRKEPPSPRGWEEKDG